MSIHTYMTDKEFHQDAINTVARLVFDRASEILSDGSPVYEHIKALNILSHTAVFAGLSNTSINVYYSILEEENIKSYGLEGLDDE